MANVNINEIEVNGTKITEVVMTNENDMRARVISWGATLCDLQTVDMFGNTADVIQGFDGMDSYLTRNPFFGSTVGRAAGRIVDGKLTIPGDPETYQLNNCDLQTLNANCHLHGGPVGFDKVNWHLEGHTVSDQGVAVAFSYKSPHLDQNYPGELSVTCTYTLTESNDLVIEFIAETSQDTICSLCNHAYFNLAGHDAGPEKMGEHIITLNSSSYLPTHEATAEARTHRLRGCYTGEELKVSDTPHDMRNGVSFKEVSEAMEKTYPGWIHGDCYIVDESPKKDDDLNLCGTLFHPSTGRLLTVTTTEPCTQIYFATLLDLADCKAGATYAPKSSFCIEPQRFADSVSAAPPSNPVKAAYNEKRGHTLLLKKGDTYRNKTVYSFSIQEPMSP
eukprot:TRINITY_DN29148_c0_g1_i1.p1 TRINITY_DN29148_c0_g1~~TRINITY_DN29148_c0_g1_i1.p1  ORF type:complete len:407 (+),score=63.54 TRINITY_DN29148_c0_g1_i1:51-1223(+)